MYNLKLLKSNYTIVINDIQCELCPARPNAIISDEQYESSTDLQKLLNKYISVEKVSSEPKAEEKIVEEKVVEEKPTITKPTKEEVIEVKPIVAEKEVVNATNASLHTSENHVENTKTLEEEKNTVNENIVIADKREKTETVAKKEASVVQDIEVVVAEATASTENNNETSTKETKTKGRRKNK